jgi:hypothetical protein
MSELCGEHHIELELDVVLYRPKLHEKGWSRFSENSFSYEFDNVFKNEELAIKYAQKWLDFEYSQDFVRIPKDLEISCDEFVLTENL